MFKKLRNKFLILHVGTVLLLIIVFFSVIFIFAYQNMEQSSNDMLNRVLSQKQMSNMPMIGRNANPKVSATFIVEIDNNKKITKVYSPFDMELSFYEGITKDALARNKESDTIRYDDAYLKYKILGNKIVFLDTSKEVQMLENMVYTFIWIAIPMLLLIFLISLYFANRSIKPIEIAYNKQKEFIADASHELKTPLATISTNVDVLLESSNSDQKKWLSYIKSETERMASLTGSLLYLAKVDYDSKDKHMEFFDFSSLVENCLMPLEAVFYENKIETDIHIIPDIKINGDSEQIRRLVGILVNNAIKYSNGKIAVSLEKVQNTARLTVFNTGVGIEKDELPKIWDRFYRGDKSRLYSGGFGLGLPIAKAIIESHKGSVSVESRVNEWTTFKIKLPLA